jgi:xeroderma pigmentosum group C-complementing protein
MKAIAKQEKDVYIRWRKLIKGLLIKARLDQMYGKTKQKEDKWASFNQQDTGSAAAGGFLPEEDNQDDV